MTRIDTSTLANVACTQQSAEEAATSAQSRGGHFQRWALTGTSVPSAGGILPAANNEPAVTDLSVKLEDSVEVVKALTGAIYALKK